tara:strand:+ start:73 stop:747 length:675 start_codon:yes stop_codon:yes gene_type:complete
MSRGIFALYQVYLLYSLILWEEHKMKITKSRLRTIIKEETLQYISKAKDKRKKEAEKLSKARKRSWFAGLDSLGRGITEEDLHKVVMEETEAMINKVYEDKVLSRDEIKKLCSKIGMRTYNQFLVALNNVEKAQSGKLFDKPKTTKEETELMLDKNCGNPYRSKETGQLTDKDEEGIKSTYFCDDTPRTTNSEKSIPSQECGRTARMKGKDIPCHPQNKKLRAK